MVERTRQPGMLVCVLPVHNSVANQEVKESVVSRRDCPPYAGLVDHPVPEKRFSLRDELFGQIGNHAVRSIYEAQVGMQPDLIGTNETKQIDSNIFRQSLQLRGCGLFTGKDHIDEHSGLVGPVHTDVMIDSLYERIARVLCSQTIDPGRDFLVRGRLIENDRHLILSIPCGRRRRLRKNRAAKSIHHVIRQLTDRLPWGFARRPDQAGAARPHRLPHARLPGRGNHVDPAKTAFPQSTG
jgi:hypothetical protein